MQIPSAPQLITPTWLTEILRAGGTIAQANVCSVDIESIGDMQGVTSQIIRLNLTYDHPEPSAPASMVAKFHSADPAQRAQSRHAFQREIGFYEHVAPHMNLRTPVCYHSDMDEETEQSLLLLEDLSGGRNPAKFDDSADAEVALAIDQAARLHAAWWERPQLKEMDWLSPIDLQWVQQIYQQRWAACLKTIGQTLPESVVEIGHKFGQCIVNYGHRLASSPRTLYHGDFQPANFVFYGDSEKPRSLVLIDWQLIGLGRGARDVASLLGRNLHPDVRRSDEMAWLRRYHDMLVEYGVEEYSFQACLEDYRLAMFVNFIMVIFNIGSGWRSEELEAGFTSVALPRVCAAILDLETGDLLDDLP